MPREEWKSISIPSSMNDEIKEFIEGRPDFRSVAEVVRTAVRIFLKAQASRFEHFNLNERGVIIRDRELAPNDAVQIHFRPEGIQCEYCETDKCVHIQYGLTKPSIREVIRKQRKDGWKLPDV